MRRKFSFLLLMFAWLCANGALLDAVQVAAWTKMFAGYAQTMPIAAALRQTLDPAKPCEWCSAVAAAKEEQNRDPQAAQIEQAAGKLVLVCEPVTETIVSAPARAWPECGARLASSRRDPVPLPPPRG